MDMPLKHIRDSFRAQPYVSWPLCRCLAFGVALLSLAVFSTACGTKDGSKIDGLQLSEGRGKTHGVSLVEPKVRMITFDDIKPQGSVLRQCWGGIGIDSQQRVYLGLSDGGGQNADDTVIFRYDTKTKTREMLGTLRGATAAAGNAKSGETFAKVHVEFLEHKGKMYFASHDFHSIKSDYSDMFDHRGAHWYSIDLAADEIEDLSKDEPDGVAVPYQGIIATTLLPNLDKLAGLTFPLGDVVVYDIESKRSTIYPHVAEYRNSNVSRHIFSNDQGKVYFSYAVNDFWLWELDVNTGEMRQTANPNILKSGSLYGTAQARDGTMYIVEGFDDLASFDLGSERLAHLAPVLPQSEIASGRDISRLSSLSLSLDGTKLYTVPYRLTGEGAEGPTLYEYDIVSGSRRQIANFPSISGSTVTGSVMAADGSLFLCMHDNGQYSARLLQIYDESNVVEGPELLR